MVTPFFVSVFCLAVDLSWRMVQAIHTSLFFIWLVWVVCTDFQGTWLALDGYGYHQSCLMQIVLP